MSENESDHKSHDSLALPGREPPAALNLHRNFFQRIRDSLWGYDFFISYHWASGGTFAVNLAQRLREKNYDVFLDRADYASGDDWKEVGEIALHNTQRLVLIATREAVTISKPVQREIELFAGRNRQVISIVFGDRFEDLDHAAHPTLSRMPDSKLYIEEDRTTLTTGPSEKTVIELIRTQRVMRRRNLRAVLTLLPAIAVIAFATFATVSWVQALAAATEATDQRDKAKREEGKAVEASKTSEKLREEAEEREYRSNVRLAHSLSISGEPSRAVDLLWKYHPRNKKSLKYRGFEWNYLWRKTRLYSPPFRGHVSSVTRVEWSPDGHRIATHGEDNRTRVWDLDSGQLVFGAVGLGNVPELLAWSSDSKFLVVGATDNLSDYRLRVLDGRTGALLRDFDKELGEIIHTSWSPVTGQIAAVTPTELIICDVKSGDCRRFLSHAKYSCSNIAWAPDGSRLAAIVDGNSTGIWTIGADSFDKIIPIAPKDSEIDELKWSPDGTRIAATLPYEADYIVDVSSENVICLEQESRRTAHATAWSPDGTRLASVVGSLHVKIWDARSGTELQKLSGHERWITNITWTHDGLKLATSSNDRSIRIWNVNSGQELDRFTEGTSGMSAVAWSPDQQLIVAGAESGGIWVWDPRLKGDRRLITDTNNRLYSVQWSPDGSRLAGLTPDRLIRTWESENLKEINQLNPSTDGFSADQLGWTSRTGVLCVSSCSADGSGTGAAKQKAAWWDTNSNSVISTFDTGEAEAEWTLVSSNSERVVVLYKDQARPLEVWDLAENSSFTLPLTMKQIRKIWLSPAGTFLATQIADRTVRIYNLVTKVPAFEVDMTEFQEPSSQVAWSPDESFLFINTFGNHSVLCDATNGRKLLRHTHLMKPPSWSPNGRFFADDEGTGSVRFWEVGESISEHRIRINDTELPVFVHWVPYGNRLATSHKINSSEGYRLAVWDVVANEEAYSISGISDVVMLKNWTPTGDRIATPVMGKGFRVWNGMDGTELVDIVLDDGKDRKCDWSPDGQQLAIIDNAGIHICDGRPINDR